MTDTELLLQFTDRTWNIDFPESIQQALENDYVSNSSFYTDDVIEYISTVSKLFNDLTPQQAIEVIHKYVKNT